MLVSISSHLILALAEDLGRLAEQLLAGVLLRKGGVHLDCVLIWVAPPFWVISVELDLLWANSSNQLTAFLLSTLLVVQRRSAQGWQTLATWSGRRAQDHLALRLVYQGGGTRELE